MTCRECGAGIADKALVCYRCGAATSAPAAAHRGHAGRRTRGVLVPIGLAAAAAAAAWYFWLCAAC